MAENYAVSAGDTASRTLDGEAVILDLDSGRFYGLNRAATRLWEVLDGGARSPEALAASLVSAYDVTPDDALRDVRHFLGQLSEAQLVAVVVADDRGPEELERRDDPYVAPSIDTYETLDQLMLSGE